MRNIEISRFNLRVYALIVDSNRNVLITEESYKGQRLNKFPGGGVQFGEGLKDALFRELREELEIVPAWYELFYVNDDLIKSAFMESEQLVAFYYKISMDDHLLKEPLLSHDPNVLRVKWRPISQMQESELSFPIDKRVCALLKKEL